MRARTDSYPSMRRPRCRSGGSRRAVAANSPAATASVGNTNPGPCPAGELERRVGPQMIEVAGVLVAATDREHASAEHIDKAVHNPRRIAPIREHPGQIVG